MDPKQSIPFNFLFRGPPGTEKTSTARKMGQVFYDAGFLASSEVVECSTSEIIGQYVGQTGPKVCSILDRALGKVLFIDEAYLLASGGHFAQEALDELVDACTKTRYQKKLVIVLAGYHDDINRLLKANPGMSSRFPEVLDFHALSPESCFELLHKQLRRKKERVEAAIVGNAMCIDCLSSLSLRRAIMPYFERACALDSWASARDIIALAESIFKATIQAPSKSSSENSGVIEVSEVTVLQEMQTLVLEREDREKGSHSGKDEQDGASRILPFHLLDTPIAKAPLAKSTPTTKTTPTNEVDSPDCATEEEQSVKTSAQGETSRVFVRDAGVTDEVWEQLLKDAKKEEEDEQEYQAKLRAKARASSEERQRIVGELLEIEAEREREAKMREQLELSGLCPAGFHWIRQEGGWRCAGGSHFVELG